MNSLPKVIRCCVFFTIVATLSRDSICKQMPNKSVRETLNSTTTNVEGENVGEAIDSLCRKLGLDIEVPRKLFEIDIHKNARSNRPITAESRLRLLLMETGFDHLVLQDRLVILDINKIEKFAYVQTYDLSFFPEYSVLTFEDLLILIVDPTFLDNPNHSVKTIKETKCIEVVCGRQTHSQIEALIGLKRSYLSEIQRLKSRLSEIAKDHDNVSVPEK